MKGKISKWSRQSTGQKIKLPLTETVDNQNSNRLFDIPGLLRQNSILQTAYDAITDLVSIHDLDFKTLVVNKAYADVVKMKPEEIIGRKCYEVLHEKPHPPRNCPHLKTLRTQKIATAQLFEPRLGKYFHMTTSPIFNGSGEIIGTVHLMKDITEHKKSEEELQQSNQRYRNLVELTSDFIWEVDKDGVYTYVSPKIYDILGYKPEEVLGKTPFDLMPPEEAKRVSKIFQEYVSQKKSFNSLENVNRHQDGRLIVLETSGVLFYDSRGKVQGYRGIDRDITQRNKTEEDLRKSEERLRQYFNLGLVGMAIDSPEGRLIEVNDRLCEIFGYSRAELMQKHWKDLTHPDDLEKDITQFEEMLSGKINHYSLEKRYIRKDGEIVHAIISVGCTRTQSGDISSIFALLVDITEQKRAEKALAKAKDELEVRVRERTAQLAESEEKYRSVVENANEVIAIVQDGIVKFLNRKALGLTGYSTEDLVSKPFVNVIHPDDRELAMERYRRRNMGEPVSSTWEFRVLTKDGGTRWAQMTAAKITWENRPAVLAMLTNVTERKKMEQELKDYAQKITRVQEEERKRIAYELHDDTAQNLALLTLEIDKILNNKDKLPENTAMCLRILRDDVDRTQNEVRRFSHELRPAVLDHLGLEAALEGLVNDINDRGNIIINLEIKGVERRLSDEVELAFFRIAQEALNNSLKHSQATRASICLRFYPKRVTLTVSDDGRGFNIEQDGQNAMRRRRLGLIGMKERAELIGGKLNIRSVTGKGVKVSLEVAQ